MESRKKRTKASNFRYLQLINTFSKKAIILQLMFLMRHKFFCTLDSNIVFDISFSLLKFESILIIETDFENEKLLVSLKIHS